MKKLLAILTLMIAFAGNAFALDVYYFYGKPRCANCKKMEAYTQSAVTTMNDKDVKYKGIDLDNPQNKSYVKKYNLYTKAVVISQTKNGKEEWKNLDKIWTKVGNEKDFKDYVISEIKQMKGKK